MVNMDTAELPCLFQGRLQPMQEIPCVLFSLYAEQGSGEKGQAVRSLPRRFQRTMAPTSNILERSLEKAHFPSLLATERIYFFSNEETSQNP